MAPLIINRTGVSEPVGAVLLSINPEGFLYPLVQSWPVSSRSAETLLVEREGDHVLFLNDLRHQNNTALNLTIPLTQTDVPAVMAVLGTTGAFTGKDYRGVDVISVLGPVPGSPWFMVAKVDTAEAYAEWQGFSALIIVLVAVTLTGALIIIGLLWQRRQKYYYQSLYTVESERSREESRNRERLEILLHLAEMDPAGEQELAAFVLDAGSRLTESPEAFIGRVVPDETVFEIAAWSAPAKDESPAAGISRLLPVENAGIWAEAVRKRTTVVVNDYTESREEEGSIPPGHDPVTRFVSIPIFEGRRVVMVFTVANRETGYTAIDVDNLMLLAQGVWNHLRRRSADELLRQKSTDLEAAFEEITATDEELRANYEDLAGMQKALAESERKHRELYHYAQVGLFETSFKDGTVLACNQRYADLAGFASVEEATGKDILGLYVNPEDRTEVGRILREQGAVENYTLNLRNRTTGKVFWARFSARFNYEREVAEGSIIDITEQKAAVESLRMSEERFRLILDNMQDAYFRADSSGTITMANPAAAVMYGYPSPEVMVGMPAASLYRSPEDRNEMLRQLDDKGRITDYPGQGRRSDGTLFWVSLNVQLTFDAAGKVLASEGFIRDITERKKAEDALQESERLYRSLFEHMLNGFAYCRMIYENSVPMDFTYLAVNESFGNLTGLKDVVGKKVSEVIPGIREADPRLIATYGRVATTGEPEQFEIYLESLSMWFSTSVYCPQRGYFVSVFDVITDRKLAEEALRRSEEHYRRLFETMIQGVVYQDNKGNILLMNPAAEQILGKTREEFLGETSVSVEHDTIREDGSPFPGMEHPAMVALRTGNEVRDLLMGVFNPKMKMYRWIQINAVPVFRPGEDHPYQAYTIFDDITDRKKAEEEQAHLAAIVEFSDEAIIGKTLDGIITSWNAGAERIYGYSADEATGRNISLLIPPDHVDDSLKILEKIRQGEPVIRYETRRRKKDGRQIDVILTVSPVRDGQNRVIGASTIAHDITERKEAEEKIKTSEIRYRRLFESAKDGILILNRDTGVIIDANPFIESLLGYAPQDLLGKHLWDIGLFKDQLLSRIAFEDLQAKEYLRYEDLPLETKDGKRIEVEFVSNVYPVDSRTFVIQCNIRDITDRKLAEELREHLIKDLEQKNAELERFTYTVSHDLKSPLITIRGFASLIEDDARAGDPLLLKKDVDRITAAAEAMQALLTDVLQLARIGKIVSPPEITPFGKIAHEAVNILAGPLAERGVTVDIPADLPDVYVDHARIREVMTNLLENAIKSFGDQPDPVIRIGVDRSGEVPVFFVQDNGIGINPRYLERIFNLFEKLNASAHGTGVGLTIVRRIIEVHGGKIWAESDGPGKGTTFRFTLPGVPARGDGSG
jgi:PAS domain S-box-containing protein